MIKTLISLMFPSKCAACGELLEPRLDDPPLCRVCHTKWERAKLRTRDEAHGQPVLAIPCDDPLAPHAHVLYAIGYVPRRRDTVENMLIFRLKSRTDPLVADFVARELAALIGDSLEDFSRDAVIAWIPRSRLALGKYGFDHMSKVARALSKRLGLPAKRLIRRRIFAKEQKRLDLKARQLNAERTLTLCRNAHISGKTVLLIDDIVTTGASIGAASRLLVGGGAGMVIPLSLAATERVLDGGGRAEDNFNIIKMQSR